MKFKAIIMAGTGLLAMLAWGGNWSADSANAKINFSIKGPFGMVHGSFSGLKATIQFNEKDLPGSSIAASIDAKTVSTGIGLRNHDLRSKEMWLNTDKYPEISFRSTKIEKTDKGYKAGGLLMLKGITKVIEVPFTFSGNEGSGLFKGGFTINREDFKIGNKGGSVGENIDITLEIPVKK
jgi:polyisoprenoid-binding protein YceI